MKTKIAVRDLFGNGNAFALIGKCMRAARKAGWSAEKCAQFNKQATSGDYDHLLQLVLKDFDDLSNDEAADAEWDNYYAEEDSE